MFFLTSEHNLNLAKMEKFDLRLIKSEILVLMVSITVCKSFYNLRYPFYFPNFFNTKLTKDQFDVRFKFIQVFSSINIEKIFWVQEFITSKLSNQRKATIKKYFIEIIELFQKYNLIENNYKYISKN